MTVTSPNSFTIPVNGTGGTGSGGTWTSIGASNTNPIVITSPGHTLATGKTVRISGVQGNTAANVMSATTVTKISDNTFSIAVAGNGTYTGGGEWKSEDSWPDREHGAFLRGSGTKVENVTFFYIPGSPLIMAGGTGVKNGQLGPWDSEKSRLWDCHFQRCYRGPEIALIDAVVGRIVGYGLRDFGIKFTSGSTQIDGYMHFFGIHGGPCMWFAQNSGNCWGSGPFYVENAPRGILIENSGTVLSNIHSHTCWVANIDLAFQSEHTTLSNLDLRVGANSKGVIAAGWYSRLLGGKITLETPSSIGVQIPAVASFHKNLTIDDITFLGPGVGQATAIDADHVLYDSRIDAHFKFLGIGLDLREDNGTSRLGTDCVINVTTDQEESPPTNPQVTAIELPATWDKSNKITVDGLIVKGSITGATNPSPPNPIVITSPAHGLQTGDQIAIGGVRGNTAANSASGTLWTITWLSNDTFSLDSSTGNGTYTQGSGWWGVWQPK